MAGRFIAGAICPQCGAMDRTRLEVDGQRRRRHCVACGGEEVIDDTLASDLPAGRLDRSSTPVSRPFAAADVMPVRLIDPGPKRPPR